MTTLTNLNILVTRPEHRGEELCKQINARDGHAIHFPTIAFGPPPNAKQFEQSIAALGQQDWLIFISPQAVYASHGAIRKAWPELPSQIKFAAVGEGTAQALEEAGFRVHSYPTTKGNSEAVLQLPEFQSVLGKKIAVIRGMGGRELIDKTLNERGAHVLPVIAYQRILPEVKNDPLMKNIKIHAMVCTSFEGVQNLKILLSGSWSYLKEVPLVVVSERIKMLAHDLGFQTIWVAESASHEAIIKILGNRNELWLKK